MTPGLGTLLADEFRFLTFRSMGPAIREHRGAFLALGLAFAWLAGIGRYWDHPDPEWWQRAGLGSVAYVFVLAGFLWAVMVPLGPRNGSYANVLTFVAMTSPPAILYAIPVERFLWPDHARTLNFWFLVAVAAWRLALWRAFVRRTAGLEKSSAVAATWLPPALVVAALALMGLQHRLFNVMGGIRHADTAEEDALYTVVGLTAWLAYLSLIPLLLVYVRGVVAADASGSGRLRSRLRAESGVNRGVEVRESGIHGTGLFVRRACREGDAVYSVAKGRIVKGAEIARLTALERNHLDRVSEDEFEVIEPPGCHINHSCEPNVEERDRRGIALRDLAAGEEITLDYDRIAHLDAPFPCSCGAAACRGVVRGRA